MNRALLSLIPLLFPLASLAQATGPYFEVRCAYPASEEHAPSCKAELQLCSTSSPADCRDRGLVTCESSELSTSFNGIFNRSQAGTTIYLKAESTSQEQMPHLTLGPAKSPPRPGRPVVSDSHLEFGAITAEGECTVRLVR